MKRYAYIRVSSKDQNIDRQLAAIAPYGIDRKDIYCDRMSGRDFARPQYNRMIKRMRPGDLLIVKSIDRLGRNYTEILEQWRHITKEIGADIFVIDMPLLDTQKKDGDLTGVFVADLVLQILSYVAQTEREFIRQRQAEGIAVAKSKGIQFGRAPLERPVGFEDIYFQWQSGEMSLREAAQTLGVSHSTFYRWCKEMEM